MGLFSAGTLVAALAPGFAVLLVARVVQAGGTAIMMPLLMRTVMTLVPPSRRGAIMGNISIVISVAPAIGPGLRPVLSVLGWRFLLAGAADRGRLPGAGDAADLDIGEPTDAPIDVASVVLSVSASAGSCTG